HVANEEEFARPILTDAEPESVWLHLRTDLDVVGRAVVPSLGAQRDRLLADLHPIVVARVVCDVSDEHVVLLRPNRSSGAQDDDHRPDDRAHSESSFEWEWTPGRPAPAPSNDQAQRTGPPRESPDIQKTRRGGPGPL